MWHRLCGCDGWVFVTLDATIDTIWRPFTFVFTDAATDKQIDTNDFRCARIIASLYFDQCYVPRDNMHRERDALPTQPAVGNMFLTSLNMLYERVQGLVQLLLDKTTPHVEASKDTRFPHCRRETLDWRHRISQHSTRKNIKKSWKQTTCRSLEGIEKQIDHILIKKRHLKYNRDAEANDMIHLGSDQSWLHSWSIHPEQQSRISEHTRTKNRSYTKKISRAHRKSKKKLKSQIQTWNNNKKCWDDKNRSKKENGKKAVAQSKKWKQKWIQEKELKNSLNIAC